MNVTDFPTQVGVVTRHLAGDTNRQIAKDLELAPNTVARILSDAEIENIREETKAVLFRALPDSAGTIAKAVKKSPQHAWELLDRTGVMPKREGESQQINIGVLTEGLPTLHEAKASQPIEANRSDRAPDASVSERGSA